MVGRSWSKHAKARELRDPLGVGITIYWTGLLALEAHLLDEMKRVFDAYGPWKFNPPEVVLRSLAEEVDYVGKLMAEMIEHDDWQGVELLLARLEKLWQKGSSGPGEMVAS